MKVRTKVKFKKTSHNLTGNLDKVRSDQVARQRVAEFLDHRVEVSEPRGRGKPGVKKKTAFEKSVDVATKRAKIGNWFNSTGEDFVGLYGICYKLVYGRLPTDINTQKEFKDIVKLATMIYDTYFRNDPDSFVEFVKWTWEREMQRIEYSFKKGFTKNRLIARYQFSRSYVEDYKVFVSTQQRFNSN